MIRGPWQWQPLKLRRLVESNLRRLRVRREQHWAQPVLDNLNRNVLAEAWREALTEQRAEEGGAED